MRQCVLGKAGLRSVGVRGPRRGGGVAALAVEPRTARQIGSSCSRPGCGSSWRRTAGGRGDRSGVAVRCEAGQADYRSKKPEEVSVMVTGGTGYIGRAVVNELKSRGYNTIVFAREKSGIGGAEGRAETIKRFEGTTVEFGDVTDTASLSAAMGKHGVDVCICCLASRTGGIKDSWLIDYQATKNCMDAAIKSGASHFVLLSAICVQKPLLAFQEAKLKFEGELMASKEITHSIVRPTAFFKSLAGQVESVKKGGPYVYFGDGDLCACKPISERDLASFIANCVSDESMVNKMLPIGGPGKAYTPREQADLLFGLMGEKPKCFPVPVSLMDGIIGIFEFFSRWFPSLEDTAEFGKIGKYYATESMLVYDPYTGTYDADATPEYGEDTLESFFKKALEDGLEGQELGDQAVFK
ncbi:3,8-divinyl protochlorophyllide a 8-vinyl reductase [Chloropicon primus]|uniref:Divinyl chlorophyllide a 8-vinyl-reductase, chloroplastic n=1 Tax=Chloropicon primus TaxID=1764295 RepID=A0A5B8MQH3_9CHLO|nr:3,8-divinyl protochlorophyllide a 8-vinyl reductase [Chloropicon primus]UPR01085.1 3,8-divinyl protochlorophyllide a 8-vinyl reductase [Chloropicon primus]|mmetsp:Transcript_13631/g.38329  ORF Transcript_13631/g.38329 Transcript_13631/m.38329 type:complete len:412 (+) Transcript_13631:374-1609(+)|eukprot:QDZ21865.1 3,8-divinyl protochlorophyllide a 8-vinyl reductase [Chloropicon primus]